MRRQLESARNQLSEELELARGELQAVRCEASHSSPTNSSSARPIIQNLTFLSTTSLHTSPPTISPLSSSIQTPTSPPCFPFISPPDPSPHLLLTPLPDTPLPPSSSTRPLFSSSLCVSFPPLPPPPRLSPLPPSLPSSPLPSDPIRSDPTPSQKSRCFSPPPLISARILS